MLEGPRRRECLLEPRGGSIKWKLELSSVRPMGAGAIQKMQPKAEKHARNMTSLSSERKGLLIIKIFQTFAKLSM